MQEITNVARSFFEACEGGRGWAVCEQYCTLGATFSAQAEPLADMRSLEDYTEWMKWLMGVMPDGRYTLLAFAADPSTFRVCAAAVFAGTHTGEGGPCPPTGKRVETEYVYVMTISGGRVSHLTKVWNSSWALREIGWA